jgi:uncharacterized membrane protein HdeD (DUF308 family)
VLEQLTRSWWLLAVRGAAAILFGILALVWPEVTLTALVLLFGAYVLIDGLVALLVAATGRGLTRAGLRRGSSALSVRPGPTGSASFGRPTGPTPRLWLALEGVLGIGAGLVTLIWPHITALVLLWLIAFWAVVTGVVEIIMAVRLRRELRSEWLLIAGGVVSLLFGLVLIVRPSAGALAVAWLIGLYAVVFGAALLMLGLRLRRLARPTRPA